MIYPIRIQIDEVGDSVTHACFIPLWKFAQYIYKFPGIQNNNNNNR